MSSDLDEFQSFFDAIRNRLRDSQPAHFPKSEIIPILKRLNPSQDPRVTFERLEKELRKPKLFGNWAFYYSAYSDSVIVEHITDWSQIERAVEVRSANLRRELADAVISLSDRQFPYFLSQLLSQVRWAIDVRVEKKLSRDGGVDFEGRYVFQDRETAPLFGQAKHWHGKVGADPIRAFVGSVLPKAAGRACVGVYVCTGGFTADAITQIRSSPFKLFRYDMEGLLDLMLESKVGIKELHFEISKLDGTFWNEVHI